MRSDRIEFPNPDGERLAGRLEFPAAEPCAFALFAHCFTCSKDIAAASRISRALGRRGIAVLRFDFTGLGNSEGDFANTSFSSNVDDLVAAADWLRATHRAPELLVGHSLGGAAVLAAAPRIAESRAVATIGAPSDPGHVRHLFGDDLAEIESRGEATVELAGRPFKIRKQFLDDLDERKLVDGLARLRRAVLILHSPVDEVVGVDHARRLYEALRHPKSFVSLDDADHLLSRRADSEYVAEILSAWVSRYVTRPEPMASEPPEGHVRVTGDARAFLQVVRAGDHELLADEPVGVGGGDAGPGPYDLLLAALGTCTSMTLGMYARHKKWSLERVVVDLRHDRVHAEDCADCEAKTGQIDRIDRELEIHGPLDAAQRQRLLEIADRCPVHRTLLNEKRIVTRLRDPGV